MCNMLSEKQFQIDKIDIQIISGDITELKVDAIVNAAKPSLMGGGGVDGVIQEKAGDELFLACEKIHNEQGKCDP